MMKINVAWANRIYDEQYAPSLKCKVRKLSKLSALHFLLKITISGVPEDRAFDALMSMAKELGCERACDTPSSLADASYSCEVSADGLVGCFCIAKDMDGVNMKEQKAAVMEKARMAAWNAKYKSRGVCV